MEDTGDPPDTDVVSDSGVSETDTGDTALPLDTSAPTPTSPLRWLLHGGGAPETASFQPFVDAVGTGSIVVLTIPSHPHPSDDQDWVDRLISLGATDVSVVLVADRTEADDPDLAAAVTAAAGIFLPSRDRSRMLRLLDDDRAVGSALAGAVGRGIPVAATGFGAEILGTVAPQGLMWDSGVLADPPFEMAFELQPGLGLLQGLLVDTQATRFGRLPYLLLADTAWTSDAIAPIGLDEATVLTIREDRTGEVTGRGAVSLIRALPTSIVQPLGSQEPPSVSGMGLWQLPEGYHLDLGVPDPVVWRPRWVSGRVGATPVAPATPVVVDGAELEDRDLGVAFADPSDDAGAWHSGGLSLVTGRGELPDTVVHTRVFSDLDHTANDVGGLLWAMASSGAHEGVLASVGSRVTFGPQGLSIEPPDWSLMRFHTAQDSRLTPAPRGPARPVHTAALERVLVDLVAP